MKIRLAIIFRAKKLCEAFELELKGLNASQVLIDDEEAADV